MRRYLILTETVTYAIKGRDILRKKGIKAKIEKLSSGKNGCSYAIVIDGDISVAEKTLRSAGIKIIEINER